MTVETETILIKLLERIEQKLDTFIETNNQKFENVLILPGGAIT